MCNLYITKKDTEISKKRNTLMLRRDNKKITELPLLKIDQVVIIGNVSLTGSAVQLLLKEDISIVYLDYYGNYKGRLVAKNSKNSIFRLKQFEAYKNKNFKLKLSKTIVQSKLKNMKVLLQTSNRKGEFSKSQEDKIQKLTAIINKTDLAGSTAELLGYEGIGSKYYFSQFNKLIKDNFHFDGRNRRPPKDPVNAMLSFGYSLLLNEIITALYLTGFDPYLGFLHSVEYSKPALALDLIEEFRQPIVDRLVKKLINMDMIEQENFEIISEKVLFNEEGRNIFLKAYEDKILSEISYNETNLSWRKVIRKQSQLLKKSIENDSEYKAIEGR